MELCTTDLHTIRKLYAKTKLSEDIVIHIASEIIKGIFYLHEHKIIYRDLKLENILVTIPDQDFQSLKSGNLNLNFLKSASYKLADFGISKTLNDINGITTTVVGSPGTMGNDLENILFESS
jgi:serine/threonine protein kinase